jgi:hypothetical protein
MVSPENQAPIVRIRLFSQIGSFMVLVMGP